MADVPYHKEPIHLELDEIDRLCHAYKHVCDQNPDIENFINHSVQVKTLAYEEENKLYLEDEQWMEQVFVVNLLVGFMFKLILNWTILSCDTVLFL